MNEFDQKHGIDVRKKRRYVALLMFAGCLGMMLSVVIAVGSPEVMPRKVDSVAKAFIFGAYGLSAMTGMALYLGYFCFKLLSWIDTPHAIAALRNILFSVDPYED